MDNPTIADLKALQRRKDLLDVHVVWLGGESFVIAHTDEERATIDLEDCELHRWLEGRDEAPHDPGYYTVVPHEPDAYSESYRGDAGPWDFEPLDHA